MKKVTFVTSVVFVLLVTTCLLVAGDKTNFSAIADTSSPALSKEFVKSAFSKLLPVSDDMLQKFTAVQRADSNGNVIWVQSEYSYNLEAFKTLPNGIVKCTKGTKKVSELTDAELKLLYGTRISGNGKEKYRDSLHLLWNDYLDFYYRNDHPPKDLIELYGFSDTWQETILANFDKDPYMITRFFSPVTYEPLDFNHAEFSPGQLYITPITDPNSPYLNIPNPDNKKFVLGKDLFAIYVRVYGEDKVIYETSVVKPIEASPPVL